MALYVKYPKTCRNKKHSAAFLTPPDSSLSSSSGSLSSSTNSGERKQHPKRRPLRYKGHTTLIAAVIPRRKKLKTKKSSGSDSDVTLPHKNNNSPDEINRNSLYSSCKSFVYCVCMFVFNRKNLSLARCLRPRECRCCLFSSRTKVTFRKKRLKVDDHRN